MSSNFIPLEEAAKRLGVTTEEIIEMRSRGEIFGYRDGASWKFKPEELERVQGEMQGDSFDEEASDSSIAMSDDDLTNVAEKPGSALGSDLGLADEKVNQSSDVALVADLGVGSDVKLVSGKPAKPASPAPQLASADDDDDELLLASDDDGSAGELSTQLQPPQPSNRSAESDLKLASGSDLAIASGSDIALGSDILAESAEAVGSDNNIIKGDSDPAISSGSLNISGSDLELADEGDLVLGGGSDLALSNDSGINLMSPSDSGISLEDEPLDLAASGISGLELAMEGSGSDVGSGVSGVGSGVDVKKGDEFQLAPSGEIETDEDSGSQVIELEDSSEFGDAAVALPADDGGFGDTGFGDTGADAGLVGMTAGTPSPMAYGVPEVPYSTWEVIGLLGILLLMCMSGILVTDVVRNMWAWSGTSDLTSSFTSMILSSIGQK